MPDKIKSARARARSAGDAKKMDQASFAWSETPDGKDRAYWFENHVVVMSCDDDEEKEQKLKEALKARVIMGQSGG